MNLIAERLNRISPSQTIAISSKPAKPNIPTSPAPRRSAKPSRRNFSATAA
jgi:hypothetical protein